MIMLKALYITLVSLGLAFTFNFLFFDKLIGISILIFVVTLLVAITLLGLRQKLPLGRIWWLAALIIFFAFMPNIRDSEMLTFLNVCATFGLLMLLAHELTGTPTFLMKLFDYFILMTLVPLQMLGRALNTVTALGQIHSNIKNRDIWVRVIKGAAMALPVLIIFGFLFSQADLAFSKFLKSFIDINITERKIQYLVLLAFAFVTSLSFLSYIFSPKEGQQDLLDKLPPTTSDSGRKIEVMVFLGLISALLLLFIGFQITYLFGGETNIVDAGFTYAEYARRGFFELLAVTMLSLLVLLVSEKYAGVESKKEKRFLVPAFLMIAEVVIVIFSAFKRLSLYIDAYSLTEQRFYGAGFIMLFLVLFILLAVKLIGSKEEQFFAFGTLLSIAGLIIVMNLINPDAFIARSNLEQYNRTGKVDVKYVGWLSADAEIWKIELYNKLEGEDKAVLEEQLNKHRENLEKHSTWQSTNLSRTKALKLLKEIE